MQQIVGSESIIQFIVTSMKIAIINTKGLDQTVTPNEMTLTQYQWGSSSFLSNSQLMLAGAPTLNSIGDPSFDNVFVAYPEYGTYAIS